MDAWDNGSSCYEFGRIMGAPQWSTRDLADAWNMVAFFGWGGAKKSSLSALRGRVDRDALADGEHRKGLIGKRGGHHSLVVSAKALASLKIVMDPHI